MMVSGKQLKMQLNESFFFFKKCCFKVPLNEFIQLVIQFSIYLFILFTLALLSIRFPKGKSLTNSSF